MTQIIQGMLQTKESEKLICSSTLSDHQLSEISCHIYTQSRWAKWLAQEQSVSKHLWEPALQMKTFHFQDNLSTRWETVTSFYQKL